jgi:putative endonuclease
MHNISADALIWFCRKVIPRYYLFPAKAGTHRWASKVFYVYLLASRPQGTLYVGSTSNLQRRVWEHKQGAIPGFTAKYEVDMLVWFEIYDSLESARTRERQIKEWKRAWKRTLIERDNPYWIDLYPGLSG